MRVTEFWGQGGDVQGAVPAPRVPAVKTTQRLTLTATPQKIVLDTNTRLVRIFADVNMVFEIIPDAATNSTLTANGELIAAGTDVHRAITSEMAQVGPLAVWARTA